MKENYNDDNWHLCIKTKSANSKKSDSLQDHIHAFQNYVHTLCLKTFLILNFCIDQYILSCAGEDSFHFCVEDWALFCKDCDKLSIQPIPAANMASSIIVIYHIFLLQSVLISKQEYDRKAYSPWGWVISNVIINH